MVDRIRDGKFYNKECESTQDGEVIFNCSIFKTEKGLEHQIDMPKFQSRNITNRARDKRRNPKRIKNQQRRYAHVY